METEFQDHNMHPLASIIGLSFWSLFLGLLRGSATICACMCTCVCASWVHTGTSNSNGVFLCNLSGMYFFPSTENPGSQGDRV